MKTKKSDLPARASRPEIPVRDDVRTPPDADGLSRRTALKMFSVTALVAATGCGARKPERHIVSLAETPEYQKPGKALHYASTFTDGLVPYGMTVKATEGRPIKIEGLAGHPLNDGTSSAAMQASLVSLYDPNRLRAPMKGAEAISWEDADGEIVAAIGKAQKTLLVTRSLLGPTERALVKKFASAARRLTHVAWEGVSNTAQRSTWFQIYGGDGELVPYLGRARVVLSVDADVLGVEGDALGATRAFAERRKVDGDPTAKALSRLWVAEAGMTVTGSNADHRIPLRPSQAAAFVDAVRMGVDGKTPGAVEGIDPAVVAALVDDLRGHRGESVVLAGAHLPAAVHAAVALLNEAVGAHGTTLGWNADPATLVAADPAGLMNALAEKPDVVLLLGVNPVHDGPDGVAALLEGAGLVVAHGLTANETLSVATMALPSAHNLESWNDAVPVKGLRSICQPLIAPLFGGRQEAESLLAWTKALAGDVLGAEDADDMYDLVRRSSGLSDDEWQNFLRRGFVGAKVPATPRLVTGKATALVGSAPAASPAGFEVVLRAHPTVGDGRDAGNPWLQELPDPVSRLVWDSAAAVGPATAKRLGVEEGQHVQITVEGRSVTLPVLVQPGTAPDVAVVTLGQGRTAGAGTGDGVGVRTAGLLGTGASPYLAFGATVAKASGSTNLVRTQKAFSQIDEYAGKKRPLALDGDVATYREDPAFVEHQVHVPELVQLHDEYDYSKGHKWAMAVDLSACTGCSACTIACQAENNIFVVGKEECEAGRELSWIRVDRYEEGDPENPTVIQQPMLCQHCDNAPCENVCPVNATAHSPEGLNEQVYNRCVGTRYCGNNCPYKVRRFNYLNYNKSVDGHPTKELLFNPQVTVRMRGVMEKCSFCVQRINAAKFVAANAGEPLADGLARPACQQACPADAIVFGDVNTEGSQVAAKRASPLGYHVLEELNVRPNVTYLAKVRNPHPSLAPADAGHGGHR